jgi:DNA adenine methylase
MACAANKEGEFNTPFGKYDSVYFPTVEMKAFAEKLATAELVTQDFRTTLNGTGEGDIVYCDPPYVPLSATANFTNYASGGFSSDDQRDLTNLCIQSAQRGAVVVVSNHDTPFTRELYQNASQVIPILVSRTISCDGKTRNKAKELIAIFRENGI